MRDGRKSLGRDDRLLFWVRRRDDGILRLACGSLRMTGFFFWVRRRDDGILRLAYGSLRMTDFFLGAPEGPRDPSARSG